MNQEQNANGVSSVVPVELAGEEKGPLRALSPNISDAELTEVAETLNGYCAIGWRIYERLKRERPELTDELMRSRTMKAKVAIPHDNPKQTKWKILLRIRPGIHREAG